MRISRASWGNPEVHYLAFSNGMLFENVLAIDNQIHAIPFSTVHDDCSGDDWQGDTGAEKKQPVSRYLHDLLMQVADHVQGETFFDTERVADAAHIVKQCYEITGKKWKPEFLMVKQGR